MGWKTRNQGLTPQEARAQLLAISQESARVSFVSSNPLRAVLLAFAAGFVISKSAPLLRWAGQTGWSLASQFLLPQAGPSSPTLERLRARTYRRSMR